MQKKHSTKRLFNLTGFDNEYKAAVQLLTEARQKTNPELTTQDAIRSIIWHGVVISGITQADIAARAAELDAADKVKAGAE